MRTHRSVDLQDVEEGIKVKVAGWLASCRDQGSILFIIIRDGWGEIQITLRKGETSEKLMEKARHIPPHSALVVEGIARRDLRAPWGMEVVPSRITIASRARRAPPFNVYGGDLPSLDKRLDVRAVDLRRVKAQAIFKIRHLTLQAIREFFVGEGFLEVQTPKIIATATEGGAALFPLLYFDKEAFLAQSPQLYKEQLTMAFDRVFEIGPIFRAEPSRTLRHLSEAISVDAEIAFAEYKSVMKVLEELMVRVVDKILNGARRELEILNYKPERPKLPMPRITYRRCLEILKGRNSNKPFGEDLDATDLKILGEELGGYYFIIDWPLRLKPFYIKPSRGRSELSESFDLMYRDLELASGGTRVHNKRLLMKRLREQGLEPKSFGHHLKVFDYGMPPHAGFGLGLDRLVMVLTGQGNIREVTAYPRDVRRLTP